MGIQSAVMAEQFGTMFQYGKRRISAMSNEEFNKLTPQMLQEAMTKQLEGMIPEMGKQIQAMRPMVELIIKEFANYILLATTAVQEMSQTAGGTASGNLGYLLEHLGHGHLPGVAGHPSLDQQNDPDKFNPPVIPPVVPPVVPGVTPELILPTIHPDVPTKEEAKKLEYPSPFHHNGVMPLDTDGTVNIAILKKEQKLLGELLAKRFPHRNEDISQRRLYDNVVKLINMFQDKYGHRFV